MTGRRLSRKALYSGSMVVFIGIFYLLSSGSALLQAGMKRLDADDLKMILLALFYLAAGVLFLRGKQAGWILSCAILLHFVVVVFAFIISLSQSAALGTAVTLTFFLFFLLLLAFLFLFGKGNRKNYKVNNKSYLLSVLTYLALLFVTFRL